MARILIIDDNPEMLEMLHLILRERGKHEVILAADGQDGLTKALAERPEMAIVDVMMPEMTGYEVVRRIRANPRIAKMRIIILTARGQPVDKTAAMAAGADAYLVKPVAAAALLDQIDELINVGKEKPKSVVIPVLSLRGGAGQTTLAVNLALLLQRLAPTLLFDMATNSGHCGFYMGLKQSNRHWGYLVDNAGITIDGLIQAHESGLKLLAAPPLPMQKEGFSYDQTAFILNVLSKAARIIVVDMPPMLNPMAQATIKAAHKILLITNDEPLGIQTTLRTLQALDEDREKVILVMNSLRSGPHPPLDAVQRALQTPLAAHFVFDPQQIVSMQRGTPILLSYPDAPTAVTLQRLAKIILA
ncbi:MAG: response regulator [Anaerolineae bacterium]|nr:response regulator [Anaerolineae bacterium]